MKILYINGYNGTKNKSIILSKILNANVDCKLIDYDNFEYKEFEIFAKNYDLIIGSSTGAYLGRVICEKFNIPLISINPVINLEKTFKKLNAKVPNIPKVEFLCLEELVLLGINDDLIDPYKTKEKLKNHSKIIFKDADHKFSNLEDCENEIIEFIKYLF